MFDDLSRDLNEMENLLNILTYMQNFTGEKDTTFCGVFDGHGPLGHDISRFVRDQLPIKITEAIKRLVIKQERKHNHVQKNDDDTDSFLEELKSYIISAFQEVDEEIGMDTVMDGYCSGTTSVNIIKKVLLLEYIGCLMCTTF